MADDMQTPEQLKFLEEELPKLKWEMELDLFTYGDESGASVRMLAHLEKHVGHPEAREWGEKLETLLKPEGTPAVSAVKAEGETAP